MRINVDNSWCQISDYTAEEWAWLDAYLSCEHRVYRPNRGRGGAPVWLSADVAAEPEDDRYHLLDGVACQFPSGVWPLIYRAAQTDGVPIQAEYVPQVHAVQSMPTEKQIRFLTNWLRDYQRDGVVALIQGGRGLLKAPTASGKTELEVALSLLVDVEWLFLVNKTDLVTQAADRYNKRTGERAGTWAQGRHTPGSSNFTVASFQAVHKALKARDLGLQRYLPKVGGVIVDEVHVASADSYFDVIQACVNAGWRFGFSATPLHRDERSNLRTIGAIGPVLHEIPLEPLIEQGLVAPVRGRMVKFEHTAPFDEELGMEVEDNRSWREVYEQCVVDCSDRNELVADMAARCARPFFVFADEIKHAKTLCRLIGKRGLRIEHVDGAAWGHQRKEVVGRLLAGELDGITCTNIFEAGVDAPALRSVVVAAGKKSAVAVVQRIGRAMRQAAGKTECEVWDVLDRGQRWLRSHADGRRRAMLSEGYEVEVLAEVP